MDKPTIMVKQPAINHPYTIETGPPNFSPVLYSVVIPVRTDMMANEKAKLDTTLQFQTKTDTKHKLSNLFLKDSLFKNQTKNKLGKITRGHAWALVCSRADGDERGRNPWKRRRWLPLRHRQTPKLLKLKDRGRTENPEPKWQVFPCSSDVGKFKRLWWNVKRNRRSTAKSAWGAEKKMA